MKIEFDEKELNCINNINEDLKDGKLPPLFINEVGREYYLNFTCVDIAKANAFVMYFMNPNTSAKELEEKFGIRINSIDYSKGDAKIAQIKETLQSFMDQLDNI